MTTGAEVVARARNYVMTTKRDSFNRLSGAIDENDTSLGLSFDASNIPVGSYLEIDTEVMQVMVAGSSPQVVRAVLGSPARSHAANTLVRVNPVVFDHELFDAMNDELADLSSPVNGLYQVTTTEFVANDTYVGYPLTTLLRWIGVLKVKYRPRDSSRNWITVENWQVGRGEDTDDFDDGQALFLKGRGPCSGDTVRVWYKAGFSALSALSENVEEVSGLHAEAVDILSMGAVMRVVAGREITRNLFDAQGDPRRAQEVPPNAQLQAPSRLSAMRKERIAAERARLRKMWEDVA